VLEAGDQETAGGRVVEQSLFASLVHEADEGLSHLDQVPVPVDNRMSDACSYLRRRKRPDLCHDGTSPGH
jgi:hypothetical protein